MDRINEKDDRWEFLLTNLFQSNILRNFLLPVGDLFFGQQMTKRLKFLEHAQWWDPQDIRKEQSLYLRNLINISYNEVPFYKQLLDSKGCNPKLIEGKQDLFQIPVSDKSILRANYPGNTIRKTGQRTYEARTSGSTGKNFTVREDQFTAGWYRATLMLSLEWAGWSIGIPHLQTGMTSKRTLDRKLKDFLLNCHYMSAYQLNDEHLSHMLEIIDKKNLKFIWGYPGSLYYLAKYAIKIGWNKPIVSAVTWGDMLYPEYRRTIEQAFYTKVFDTYGCSEGFHIAAQCGSENHYHIHDLDVIVEFIDDDGYPVPEGTPGNVVITRLHPGPMPLIRYRVGDVAVAKSGVCKCGRGFSLLEKIQGRDTDIVITPGGNRLIVHFFTGILEHFPEIDSYQVIQETPTEILLKLIPKSSIEARTKERIIDAMKKKGIDDLKVIIEIVPEIPMSDAGKRRFIINRLGKTQ